MATSSYVATAARNAGTPYGLRAYLGRYFLTFNGRTMPSQYGSMDRDTALRIYKMYRNAWLAPQA